MAFNSQLTHPLSFPYLILLYPIQHFRNINTYLERERERDRENKSISFLSSVLSKSHLQSSSSSSSRRNMEVAVELEDDVFFADLNKQISLLIMDDDEDPVVRPSVPLQAISKAIQPARQPPLSYQQTCTRESKGTGVFIPQSSSHPRRKNKQGKFSSSSSSSSNAKLHGHSDHSSRGLPPHAAYNYSTNIPSHNISFNAKRS